MDYKYRLVMFLNKKKEKEIDIVPTSWLENDETSDTLLCKFMPKPYTKKSIAALHQMLKNCEKPLVEWPSFPVDLRGRAYTYEEAEEKALLLERKPYAYSTDSEYHAKKKATEDRKSLKFKSLSSKESLVAEKLKEINIDLNENVVNIDGLDKKNKNALRKPNAAFPKKKTTYRKVALDSVESSGEESRGNTSWASSDSSSSVSPTNNDPQQPPSKFVADKKQDAPFARTKKHSEASVDSASVPQSVTRESTKGLATFGNAEKKDTPSASANKGLEDRLFKFFDGKYNSLNYKIGELQGQIIEMTAALNSIQGCIEKFNPMDNGFIDTNKNFTEEALSFSLPCQNYDEFKKLDEELTTSETFRKKMIRRILLSLNKKSGLRRNLGQIIREFMTRDLALTFTTSKAVTGKHVFSETKLYMCFKDVTSTVFKEQDGTDLTEPTFKESVRVIFNNAKDWDGQRNVRKKKFTEDLSNTRN